MEKAMISTLTACVLAFGVSQACAALADHYTVKPEVTGLENVPVNVMVIGNSYSYYNCGVFDYLWGFASDQKVNLFTAQATIAGADLDWHNVEYLINPPGQSAEIIYKRNKKGVMFDAVLLQPNSISPIDPPRVDNFKKWAAEHVKTIRKAGSEPAFVMTWARKGQPEMTKALADAVGTVANQHDVLVIPVGLAFALSQERDATIELIMPDKSHPTAAGSYLESAVIYSALMKKPLKDCKFLGGCEKPLKPEVAKFLQEIAWETVKTYYGWK